MKDQQKFRLINESLLNAVLTYLDERPHKEVRGLVDALVKCPPVNLKEENEDKEEVETEFKIKPDGK